MIYQKELLGDGVISEMASLLHDHYMELAPYRDVKLDPDWGRYMVMQDEGMTHFYTVRADSGGLIGYAMFFLMPHLHYKSFMVATCDVFYMSRKHRALLMVAKHFLEFCDEQLKQTGAQAVVHRYKIMQPALGKLIRMLGYQDSEVAAMRRL